MSPPFTLPLVLLCCFSLPNEVLAALRGTYLRCDARKEPINVENNEQAPVLSWIAELVPQSLAGDTAPLMLRGARQRAFRVVLERVTEFSKNSLARDFYPSRSQPVADSGVVESAEPRWQPHRNNYSHDLEYLPPLLAKSSKSLPALILTARAWYRWRVQIFDERWRVGPWSEYATFRIAPRRGSDWAGASWISPALTATDTSGSILRTVFTIPPHGDANEQKSYEKSRVDPSADIMRPVHTSKEVVRVVVDACGLGQFDLSVNGNRVAEDELLNPSWTNYRKTCQFSSFDITKLITGSRAGGDGQTSPNCEYQNRPRSNSDGAKGEVLDCHGVSSNAMGVILGNGMYNVPATSRYTKFVGSMGPRSFIAQVSVTYNDGSTLVVAATNASTWRTSSTPPIIYSHTYGGEDFDARLVEAGWDTPDFNDANWTSAVNWKGPGCKLVPAMQPALRIMEIAKSINVTSPSPGVQVYDLGRNFAGVPRIVVQGPAGAKVRLVCGELLDKDTGLPSQATSGSPQWYTYTLAGKDSIEIWSPRFSIYGFRWVLLNFTSSMSPFTFANVTVHSVEGLVVYTSAAVAGSFNSSNILFNRIHSIVLESMKANFLSVWADCPHREKLGWLEVSHLLAPSAIFNYDMQNVYSKIITDIAEAQIGSSGLVPDIAPEYVVFSGGFRDSPEWGSAFLLLPQFQLQFYSDGEAVKLYYSNMSRYANYIAAQAEADGVVAYGLGDWCDANSNIGGCGPDGQLTPLGVTASSILFADYAALAQYADLLHRPDEAAFWRLKAEKLGQGFLHRFWDPSAGVIGSGSQCASAMPLFLGMLNDIPNSHNCRGDSDCLKLSTSNFEKGKKATAHNFKHDAQRITGEDDTCLGAVIITEATYGPNCGGRSGNANEFINNTCKNVSFPPICVFPIDSHQLGDPCPGQKKDFVVKFKCSPLSSCPIHESAVPREANGRAVRVDCSGLPTPISPTPQNVLEQLIRDIGQRNNHQTGGDIGHRFILMALRNHNRSDVVDAITKRLDYPSYGYILSRGATSLPEQWDGSGSQLHSMLGHIDEWFYSALAGIRLNISHGCNGLTGVDAEDLRGHGDGSSIQPGLTIQPYFPEEDMNVSATYRSVCGNINVSWERQANNFRLYLRIPVGLGKAVLVLPSSSLSTDFIECMADWSDCMVVKVMKGKSARDWINDASHRGIMRSSYDGHAARLHLVSGSYWLQWSIQ